MNRYSQIIGRRRSLEAFYIGWESYLSATPSERPGAATVLDRLQSIRNGARSVDPSLLAEDEIFPAMDEPTEAGILLRNPTVQTSYSRDSFSSNSVQAADRNLKSLRRPYKRRHSPPERPPLRLAPLHAPRGPSYSYQGIPPPPPPFQQILPPVPLNLESPPTHHFTFSGPPPHPSDPHRSPRSRNTRPQSHRGTKPFQFPHQTVEPRMFSFNPQVNSPVKPSINLTRPNYDSYRPGFEESQREERAPPALEKRFGGPFKRKKFFIERRE
jgi:hypothetical protein